LQFKTIHKNVFGGWLCYLTKPYRVNGSVSLSYSSTTTELSTLLNTTYYYVKMVASTTIEFKPNLSSYSNLATVILQWFNLLTFWLHSIYTILIEVICNGYWFCDQYKQNQKVTKCYCKWSLCGELQFVTEKLTLCYRRTRFSY